MTIGARQAAQLLSNNGPRFYVETMSATGSTANLDHPIWGLRPSRYLVHLDTVGLTPEDCAAQLISNVLAFRSGFLGSQPAGTPFPGFGVRLAGLGGAYGFRDFSHNTPFASEHPDDALPQFINAFTYTEGAPTATVTSTGLTPTDTTFKIGSGPDIVGRPNGGLVNNSIEFTTGALAGDGPRKVTAWNDNTVTVDAPFSAAPSNGDQCEFSSDPPFPCFRFEAARVDLKAWSDVFFDEIDATWPAALPPPEFITCTTENIRSPSDVWYPPFGILVPYIEEDVTNPSLLTNTHTFNEWIAEYGKNLDGQVIDLDDPPSVIWTSPIAKDYRSLAYGAFIIGLAWTWQLSFVNRMKQTWPKVRFHQYQLHNGNRSSPVRTQPGELFYHGEPWPPDVGHSHDEYVYIFPFSDRLGANAYEGKIESVVSNSKFQVTSASAFAGLSGWGGPFRTRIRFATDTPTTALQNQPSTITAWNSTTRGLDCVALPATPATTDVFFGYVETQAHFEWENYETGWDVWKAFEAIYHHTGTLEEIYRQTCISWVTEIATRMTAAWPRHSVAPFIQRQPETSGSFLLTDEWLYPDGPLLMPPGIQPREDWVTMLSNMMDVGIVQTVVFEPNEESTLVLDSWAEILSGVQRHFTNHLSRLELIAPHQRSRGFRRNRRLWRH